MAAAQKAVESGGLPPNPFTFSLSGVTPFKNSRGGNARLADSTNFKVSHDIAAVLETIKPGGLREMHWHPNADEWQYWIKGEGRMTVFDTGPKAQTQDFRPGDIGLVKRNMGHFIQNTGNSDIVVVALFKTSEYAEVSLSDWLTHTPPELVAEHLNIDPSVLANFPNSAPGFLPA
jgi:oxalate decarboxylase